MALSLLNSSLHCWQPVHILLWNLWGVHFGWMTMHYIPNKIVKGHQFLSFPLINWSNGTRRMLKLFCGQYCYLQVHFNKLNVCNMFSNQSVYGANIVSLRRFWKRAIFEKSTFYPKMKCFFFQNIWNFLFVRTMIYPKHILYIRFP